MKSKAKKRSLNKISTSTTNTNTNTTDASTNNVEVGWKDVSVSLVDDDHDDDFDHDDNHYDNPKLSSKALIDLPAQPGEEVGMFYGLQVLDGSQYEVVGTGKSKRLKILTTSSESQKETTQECTTETSSKQKKNAKKQDKKDKQTTQTVDSTKEPLQIAPPTSSSPETEAVTDNPTNDDPSSSTSLSWEQVQQNWTVAAKGAVLHERLCSSLARLGFAHPTPIQAETMSASILGRRNLVGAAPTGSGKTLAFLLPIFQCLLDQPTTQQQEQEQQKQKIRAMIITPTRELATQIYEECEKLVPNHCVTLVGGVAQVKQQRLLQTKRPPIIVGTPGRLWAMISSGEQEHLKDLSQIQFLVLDEADRLTQDHSFPQLLQILERIHQENPGVDADNDDNEDDEDDTSENGEDRLLGLPGIRGEAPLTMLTPEILKQIEEQRQTMEPPQVNEDDEDDNYDDDDYYEKHDEKEEENELDYDEVFNVANSDNEEPRVHRQTFIYSATLTLPFTSTKSTTSNSKKSKRRHHQLDGGLAEILEKTHAMGETKVVDLTSSSTLSSSSSLGVSTNSEPSRSSHGVRLPPGLRLEQIKCTQRHKDSHLYAYLMTTKQGSSGPSLIFCNSIAAVRRVGTTLQTLGLSVRILHAHMQQRARFKAVESLSNESNNRAVVVCTDVAARGLDIPSVATVIHYDVARAVDTFVHRAGRTARGMGQGAVGVSLSLIAPAEDKAQSKIVEALQVDFSKIVLDGRLLTSAQERVNLASKIVIASSKSHKMQSQNQWFLEKAKEAELELDDDLLEGTDNLTDMERSELKEANAARSRLAQLLAQPMKTQRFGKFLSTNSAAMQDEIKPLPQATNSSNSQLRLPKKKKRKVTK